MFGNRNIVDLKARPFKIKSSKCSQTLHLQTRDFLSAFYVVSKSPFKENSFLLLHIEELSRKDSETVLVLYIAS